MMGLYSKQDEEAIKIVLRALNKAVSNEPMSMTEANETSFMWEVIKKSLQECADYRAIVSYTRGKVFQERYTLDKDLPK